MLRTQQVLDQVEISFRQLDYWSRTGLIPYEIVGHDRYYAEDVLYRLHTIKLLLDMGYTMSTIRHIESLREEQHGRYIIFADGKFFSLADDAELLQYIRTATKAYTVIA